MYLGFSKLFQQISKDFSAGTTRPIPLDDREWPDEWKTTYYKEYGKLQKVALPAADAGGHPLFSLIQGRQSRRNFDPNRPLSLQELSLLLKYSCGEISSFNGEQMRRAQPSGGARFPVEVYPLVLRGSPGLPSGVYHYNVSRHALDTLWQREFSKEDIAQMFTYPWVQNASVVLLMTAVFYRTQMKYGERGYRFTLLEAGHIGQNLYLLAESAGLKCCALAGTRDPLIEELLGIDGLYESLVHTVVLGK